MALTIDAVMPARFPVWVRRRTFALLFLGEGTSVRRPHEILRGLDMEFGDELSVGWMARETVPWPGWWEQNWRTELGPFRRQGVPPDGLYVFHNGYVVGYHGATAAAGGPAEWAAVRAYVVDRMRLKARGDSEKQAGSWTRREEAPRRDPPPPSRSRPPLPEGPYEVLEVAPSASDEEVRKAYRTALKLNHPDRVAHLSRHIQQFARERTQLIIAAWEEIKGHRGLK